MDGKRAPFPEMPLDNGLTLHFEDRSRPIPGGRSQVVLCISIPFRVTEFVGEDSEITPEQAAQVLGDTVTYSVEKVRNFVPQDSVGQNLEQMREEFIRSNLAYLLNPSFPKRFLIKKYWEALEARRLEAAHSKTLRNSAPEHDD
ncbi:MAG TPA: hypothetical protein PK250_10590 [Syntrophobacter fumaroxidans]|nr:hypothetical protein [Syntrophobacter fumaroxidans]